MGTPEYARVILERLVAVPGVTMRVVSQPDRPRGRGRRVLPSPVSAWALSRGIPLDRPQHLGEGRALWQAFDPDVVLTAAFGRILPAWLLDMARCGPFNLHASLLPRWRGPNPIGWSLWAGDAVTGVTLLRMTAGVDAGPVVAARALEIDPRWDAGRLTEHLAELAADLAVESLPLLCRPDLPLTPQPEADATYAPKFPPDFGRLDFSGPAEREARRVRAATPEPGAYTAWGELRLKVAEATAEPGVLPLGEARLDGADWVVGCGTGVLRVKRVQPAGGRWMTPAELVRGRAGEKAQVKLG
ncbi:MAG: methionyl-tRNA formyltransferase [Firmicutes bacterium]|nr:methionyl-tRNA formyltransferase [Alicyclobacillaceae bacterium]MCL6496436.1 methionyl-tRNA formyltransferase [Bacillota bacterium]